MNACRDDMTRLRFLESVFALALLRLTGCSDPVAPEDVPPEVVKTAAEWLALLSHEAFAVLFLGGTEPPGTSPLDGEYREGTYICAACFNPLFLSATKYETETGWPSFWQPIEGRLGFKHDFITGVERIEYHCFRCAGHQGHLFHDGPPPTGERYCNNGLALEFVLEGQPLPALRT
jgi:peptide-methionine (R)-S-oxide reductase